MTSDAKIGLLLGLVFIFIIAFIINGLPSFKSETDNNELTTTMVSLNKQLGIGSGVSDSEVLDRPGLLERPVLALPVVIEDAAVEQSAAAAQGSPAAGDSELVRYSAALPGSNSNNELSTGMFDKPTKTIEIVAPAEQVAVVMESPSVEENLLRQASSDVVAKVDRPTVTAPKIKEYVVQDGDSLGSISKKLYGEELGNKKANIDAIFDANKKALKSPDAIFVGQKLIIPTIEGSPATVAISEDKPLGSSMLERVKQIGQRGAITKKEEPVAAVGVKYVVKEGDNLWKIAHKELGDGNRFTEIVKMNSDVLKNKDSIVVGMPLVLPKK